MGVVRVGQLVSWCKTSDLVVTSVKSFNKILKKVLRGTPCNPSIARPIQFYSNTREQNNKGNLR